MTSILPLCDFLFLFLFFFHLQDIMNSEKSYDSLPNFTAADCEFDSIELRSPMSWIEEENNWAVTVRLFSPFW